MSAFQDQMRQIAEGLSPEAKDVVKQVLASEHKQRFGNRADLPESYATWALKAAKMAEEAE